MNENQASQGLENPLVQALKNPLVRHFTQMRYFEKLKEYWQAKGLNQEIEEQNDPAIQAARQLAEKKDEVIRQAITNHLGRTDWTLKEVLERLSWDAYIIDPMQSEALEYLLMDGQPIAVFSLVQCEQRNDGRKLMMDSTFTYRILNNPLQLGPASKHYKGTMKVMPVEIMAIADGYAMVRYEKGLAPFVCLITELSQP